MMFQNKDLSRCVMQLVTGSVPNKHRGLLGGLPVLAVTLNFGGFVWLVWLSGRTAPQQLCDCSDCQYGSVILSNN